MGRSPSLDRTLFLVNGGTHSAAGERARRIAVVLGRGRAGIVYRASSRAHDLVRFLSAAAGRPYRVLYAMDLSVVPIAAAVTLSYRRSLVVDTGDAPAAFLKLIAGVGVSDRAKIAVASGLEFVGYGRAREIVVRGSYQRQDLAARGYSNVSVVPDGVDLGIIRPTEDSELRRLLRLEGVFTIGVQGTFTWYDALGGGLGCEVIEAIALAYQHPIHAVLIGEGPGISRLRLLASRLGVGERLHVVGHVPYGDLARYLGLCDVCVLTQTNEPSSWVRTTGKLPGYLAAGRYVLASRVGTAADILPEEMLIDYHGSWDQTYPLRLAERMIAALNDSERAEKGLALCELATQFDYNRVAHMAADVVNLACAKRQ